MVKNIQVSDETWAMFDAVRTILGVKSDSLLKNLMKYAFGSAVSSFPEITSADIEQEYAVLLSGLHEVGDV